MISDASRSRTISDDTTATSLGTDAEVMRDLAELFERADLVTLSIAGKRAAIGPDLVRAVVAVLRESARRGHNSE